VENIRKGAEGRKTAKDRTIKKIDQKETVHQMLLMIGLCQQPLYATGCIKYTPCPGYSRMRLKVFHFT